VGDLHGGGTFDACGYHVYNIDGSYSHTAEVGRERYEGDGASAELASLEAQAQQENYEELTMRYDYSYDQTIAYHSSYNHSASRKPGSPHEPQQKSRAGGTGELIQTALGQGFYTNRQFAFEESHIKKLHRQLKMRSRSPSRQAWYAGALQP
jgi:hypothetical protein